MQQQCTTTLKNAKKIQKIKKSDLNQKKSDLNKKIWFFWFFYWKSWFFPTLSDTMCIIRYGCYVCFDILMTLCQLMVADTLSHTQQSCSLWHLGGDGWTFTFVFPKVGSRTSVLLWWLDWHHRCVSVSRTMRTWWNSSCLWGICLPI